MLDTLYISFFNLTKKSFKQKSIRLSLLYITLVEMAFYSLIAVFFMAFASHMNIGRLSSEKAIIIACISVLCIYFKNWMQYNGKRRTVLNAKSKKRYVQPWKLVAIPIACIILTIVFYQAI